MTRRHAFWSTLLLSAASLAWPQEPAPGAAPPPVSWSSLSEQQQKLLQNFHGQWDDLPPGRQQALSGGASRWLRMTPEQRAGARDRFQNWQKVPPEQQSLIRQRWQRFQQLTPVEQAAVRQNYHAYSGLPLEQRQRLRQRWLDATPQQRMQMLQNQRARGLQRGLAPPVRGGRFGPPPPHR
jgi:DNA-binding PucR family transcriptional regulator